MTGDTLRTRFYRVARVGLVLGGLVGAIWAQEQPATRRKPTQYVVTDLGPLANNPFSLAVGISQNGLVNGGTSAPDGSFHATLWFGRAIVDLATPGLGGANSEAFGVNERGHASGLAETSTSDPNGEDFCGFGTHVTCLPFLWHSGVMTALPTLGGNNGEAGEINNLGEVAGNAENSTVDSTCPVGGPQVFEEKPVIWENGRIKKLDTARSDPDGWAFGINENGEAVGASGICSALNPESGVYILSRHALLWDKGKAIDLGNLGGTGTFGPGNIGGEINNQDQVVGTSDLKSDTSYHAFLWTKEKGIRDLGTLPGDVNSAGLGINGAGDIVGASFDADGDPRAFVRLNGVLTDLNTLTPADSPLYLLIAHGINSRGEVVGFGVDGTGDVHAFLATPRERTGEISETIEKARPILTENVRKLVHSRMGFGRFPHH